MRKFTRPAGGLWSNDDFLKLWAGQSISEVGSQISQFALPLLAAINLHCSPFQFALLGVLGFLPFILFALPAGVWVDRLHRRRILIVGDASRAVLLALIPILWATHVLQMWHLLVLTFVIGVFTVFFDVAYQSYLPALIDRDHLVEGNAKLQLTVSVAQVAGPSASTSLVIAVTAPYAIIGDAISFVVSSAFMLRMRHREDVGARTAGQPRSKMWPDVKEGLRWVVGHPWLRAIATCTGSSNFFSSVLFSIGLLYMLRGLHMPKYQLGIVFGVGGAGSILGALIVNRLNKRIGVGPTIVLTAIMFSIAGLGFALAPADWVALPMLILAQALFGFGAIAYNISQV